MRIVALVALVVPAGIAASAKPPEPFWTEGASAQIRKERSLLARVAERALPAVVSITTEPFLEPDGPEPQKGLGAGFVVHPDGWILTASHVVEDAAEVLVRLEGEEPLEVEARVVGQDADTDVALLKIETPRPLPVLKLASADSVEIADWIIVIGNPFGLGHTVTVGVVSHKGRGDIAPSGRTNWLDYLQTDASINPGSSGGPVLNAQGEVVAMANAVNTAGQGIGFAVPIDWVKPVLPALKAYGTVRRPWLGAHIEDVAPDVARLLGPEVDRGPLVVEVDPEGPGAAAGLKPGDVVIALDGQRIHHARKLMSQVASSTPGRTASLEVRRNGRPLRLSLKLKEARAVACGDRPGCAR